MGLSRDSWRVTLGVPVREEASIINFRYFR
jgi:hypothetical protein